MHGRETRKPHFELLEISNNSSAASDILQFFRKWNFALILLLMVVRAKESKIFTSNINHKKKRKIKQCERNKGSDKLPLIG